MSELAKFTYEGIPPLPEGPSVAETILPSPGLPVPPQQFNMPQAAAAPGHGIPLFELIARKLPDGSFMNIEAVQILTPGDTKATPMRKVTDEIRIKYRAYYEVWKAGLKMSPVGTPLEMWPLLTPALVMQLKTANIFTVEQLSNIADVHLHLLPTGQLLRQQAKDWLEVKDKSDKVTQQTAENQALKDNQRQMADTIASLQAQLAAMQAQMNGNPATQAAAPAPVADDAVPHPNRHSPTGRKQ